MNSGIQSSCVDVQVVKAFRVQTRVQSVTIEYTRIIHLRIAAACAESQALSPAQAGDSGEFSG